MIVHLSVHEIVLMQNALRVFKFHEHKLYDILSATGSQEVLEITKDNMQKANALIGLLDDYLIGYGEENVVR